MIRAALSHYLPVWHRQFRRFLASGRAFLLLSFCSMVMFVLLGLGGILQIKLAASPAQSMKGFAASVSDTFFSSMLGLELPQMDKKGGGSRMDGERIAAFLLRFLTDVNPGDPKSLLAAEMPGAGGDEPILFRTGSGGSDSAPEDYSPPATDSTDDPGTDTGTQPGGGTDKPDPTAKPEPDQNGETANPAPTPDKEASPGESKTTEGRKVVFIYHSHNRESYYPELPPSTKDPNSGKVNVTSVGKRLADQLEKRGIGALHSSKDYAGTVKDYDWNQSYKYSKQTVTQAMAGDKDLTFFFDIHRDSLRRKESTVTIGGKDYAQVFFIIGQRNPNWKQNESFANEIHEKLESTYPGLSRGIWGKTAATGNGEYNQSLAPDSVLIEIGGVDNTLEECYRTADALAKTIADLYWQNQHAEAADAGKNDAAKAG
ncbi:stage II sporulation protein P [Cohnella sp. GCM10012308]|uniref:stage II sporulation protein P n=1 Tax=Cohnella sp. GCM10012308 TaxID=3317329 RepID=UPI00361E27F4